MAQQEFYTILTAAGLAYEANRKASGLPIKLVAMSVGDGNGSVYNPAATQTALRREVWRGPINALLQDNKNPSYLVGELSLPDDVGGWYVREVGFWTDTGVLYAIGKYPESFKPLLSAGAGKEFYIRAIFETSSAENVVLVVDDQVVKATRAFVIDYVAAELAKLDSKQSVRVATTGPVSASGLAVVDGVQLAAGDRVLRKDEADSKINGIYVASVGAWSRASDADASIEVTPGMLVPVEAGAANGDSLWQLVTDAPIVLGTTPLVFEVAAGPVGIAAGTYRSVTIDKRGRVVGGTNPTTLGGFGILDGLRIKSDQQPTFNAASPGESYANSALEIREAALIAGASSDIAYAPSIVFHWGAKIAKKLLMDSAGRFWLGGGRIITTEDNIGASQAETEEGALSTKFVTPKTLKFGFSALLNASAGYLKFPAWMGSFLFQWGKVPSSGGGISYTFPMGFSSEVYGIFTQADATATNSAEILQPGPPTLTGFNAYGARDGGSSWVTANIIGWYFAYGR